MSSKPRLDRVRALAEANLQLQQFGQGNDDEVHLGATACTHAVCQFLSLVWNGTIPTLNRVNRLAGMKANATNEHGKPRGMFQSEFKQFLKNADIPMELRFGLPFGALLKAADDGPVFYAMRYGSAPKKTKAHPNGTTQTGPKVPDTRHAVLMLGHLKVAGPNGGPSVVEVYRKDPNHGSKIVRNGRRTIRSPIGRRGSSTRITRRSSTRRSTPRSRPVRCRSSASSARRRLRRPHLLS